MIRKLRIIALVGSETRHMHTAATLLDFGVILESIFICNNTSIKSRSRYLKKYIGKNGLLLSVNRLACRVVYKIFNNQKDQYLFNKLYNVQWIKNILNSFGGEIHYTHSFNDSEIINKIRGYNPDIILVHTGSWIGKTIRSIPKIAIIGGHPGVTPFYRGVHSTFWAIYNQDWGRIGCTIFHLDGGVDTGDIINQRSLVIEKGDSFVTVGWKGMINQVEMMVQVINNYSQGIPIPRRKKLIIPDNSYYDFPTIQQYIKYRHKQNICR